MQLTPAAYLARPFTAPVEPAGDLRWQLIGTDQTLKRRAQLADHNRESSLLGASEPRFKAHVAAT